MKKGDLSQSKMHLDKKELEFLYLQEKKTIEEIAWLHQCSVATIKRAFKMFGIHSHDTRFKKGHTPWNKGKSIAFTPRKYAFSKQELEDLYLKKKKSGREIAEIYGCRDVAVYRALRRYNIPIRDISTAKKGHTPWNKGKKGVCKLNSGSFKKGKRVSPSTEFKKGHKPWNKEKHGVYTEETIQRIREARMKQQIPTSKTKPERILEEIIRKYNLPYKYTGDGSFWIGGINPDFVNCNSEKIAIEVFGDYWHDPEARPDITFRETEYGRKKIFEQYGWKLIIFWESEIYNLSEEEIVNKLSRAQYIVSGNVEGGIKK